MPSLSREHRRFLENTVAQARQIAEEGARKVLKDEYAVEAREAWSHMTPTQKELRTLLRAHARQLGDKRDSRSEIQEIRHLVEACAYEHWHRMLFARFLAENDLLLDSEHGVPMTLDEVQELAREQQRDWIDIAAELAERMLLAVFRPDDPVLKVQLPPETQQQLEEKLAGLPSEIFLGDDGLGWVYQFWQRDEKERVNKSEVKIGADELPAVTQLFTEDYMVLFLLENTLGAWWTAKRRAEGKDTALLGYEWTYLRLSEDGSPAAGSFDGWPRTAKELKVVDPCMGSGHFLVFALPILARMRMDEESLSLRGALTAVLQENLFGLEIDPRCSQIAAFNLALAAWRLAGEHFALPELQLACSGLGPNCTKEQWMKLAEEIAASCGMPAKTDLFGSEDSLLSEPVRNAMEVLYELFSQAPLLGSLIDPANLHGHLFEANYQAVAKLLAGMLSAQSADENMRERLIAAAGMAKAADLLSGRFTLIATNVPYLGRGDQCDLLKAFIESYHSAARSDLATAFLDRLLNLLSNGNGGIGTLAIVVPQNWLFLTSYRELRKNLLSKRTWQVVARLGPAAFRDMNWWAANTALIVLSASSPQQESQFVGIDVSSTRDVDVKASLLRGDAESMIATPERLGVAFADVHGARANGEMVTVKQVVQLGNPDSRIILADRAESELLGRFAEAPQGIKTGDDDRYRRRFWECWQTDSSWRFYQSTPGRTGVLSGMTYMIDWRDGGQKFARLQGQQAWGRAGVAVGQMNSLPRFLYWGDIQDSNINVIVPRAPADLPALAAFVLSDEFPSAVRSIDQKVAVTNATMVKIPFDLAHWRRIATQKYPNGLPKPHTDDPTQWLFNGHPKGSYYPLHVAIARLIGYQWPRQTGSRFPDCPALGLDGLEKYAEADGIVPLTAIAGESSAAERLRALLVDSFGSEWSAAKLHELLGKWDSLEEWLRDGFFEEHCDIFHQRPFVWHVWDGRKDGFHALMNYHKLAAPNGEGRQTLEKLIYTWLGRWIDRQNDEVRAGKEAADARLTAALHLKAELEKILAGEKPYDIFVRWKAFAEQPFGWEPDINDGVRVNIRPWLTTTLAPSTKPKKDACILRATPKIKYGRDRGTEPRRKKEDFPWFWSWDPAKAEPNQDFIGNGDFEGARWNDLHYSRSAKQDARTRKASQKDHKELAATTAGDTTTK